jgi:hypothetical protein
MKKSSLKYVFASLALALGIVAVSVYSCEKEVIVPNDASSTADRSNVEVTLPVPGSICGKIEQKAVILAGDEEIGEALIYNDVKYFYVHITTIPGYYMKDANMHICKDFNQLPLDEKGNPDISKFTYSIVDKPLSTVRKFRVGLQEMSGVSNISVAIQTKHLRKSETDEKYEIAWIDGRKYGTTVPGRVFGYEKTVCLENQETSVNE